jgi:hypothetical protein
VGHGQQPGLGRPAVGVEARRGAPGLDEDLLGDLLGLRRVADDLLDHAVDQSGIAVVQLAERRLVAARDVGEQLFVGPDLAGFADRSQVSLRG